jgi:hypothetical protein
MMCGREWIASRTGNPGSQDWLRILLRIYAGNTSAAHTFWSRDSFLDIVAERGRLICYASRITVEALVLGTAGVRSIHAGFAHSARGPRQTIGLHRAMLAYYGQSDVRPGP